MFLCHVGGCQNYGPFLGTLNIRCCIIIGIQNGTIILTTTHVDCQLGERLPLLVKTIGQRRCKTVLRFRVQGFKLPRVQTGEQAPGSRYCAFLLLQKDPKP